MRNGFASSDYGKKVLHKENIQRTTFLREAMQKKR